LKTIWSLAQEALALDPLQEEKEDGPLRLPEPQPQVGVIRDKSFWFYYPENLKHLEKLGARLIDINSLEDREVPAIDALYIGGGFPETQAQALADNVAFRAALKQRIEEGSPGLRGVRRPDVPRESPRLWTGRNFPCWSLPLSLVLEKKPQGHGYTVLEVTGKNPYYPVGEVLKGHEFHYSKAVLHPSDDTRTVFKVLRGEGIDGK